MQPNTLNRFNPIDLLNREEARAMEAAARFRAPVDSD